MTGRHSFVCLCLDLTEHDLDRAIAEGFTHSELVKRYTGAFMGPCQGKSCMDGLLELLATKVGDSGAPARRPTMRPPAYPVTFAMAAALPGPEISDDDEEAAC